MTPAELLHRWIVATTDAAAARWLDQQLAKLSPDAPDRELHLALGLVPRRLSKADLALGEGDLEAAHRARPGWTPRGWSVDQAGRVLILLSAAGAGAGFAQRFAGLCRTADVTELLAFYRGLPLYPRAPELEAEAARGARSSMRAVFEAVAHHSPYPKEQFGEERWNQLVLKALFIGSPLEPIQGLDQRANLRLARMLVDYASERRAAGRAVPDELWRCVRPFARAPELAAALPASDVSADSPPGAQP